MAMGEVWRARHEEHGEQVAVKIISEQWSQEEIHQQEEARRRAAGVESRLRAAELRRQEEAQRQAADKAQDTGRAPLNADGAETLLKACEQNMLDLEMANIVQALHQVANFLASSPDLQALFRPDPRLSSLINLLPSRGPELSPKGLSIVAWALAVLQRTDTELMTLIENETQRQIQGFSPQGISNTV